MVISRSKVVEFDSVKSIIGDMNHYDKIYKKLIEFDPEVIIHLAWEGIPDFSVKNCHKNLNSAIKFFNLLIDSTNCKKIIVAGSCFEYGTKKGACKEEDQLKIESYFTWAKHSLNQYLSIKCAENDIILNWFRIFYVYGPGQREGSLIPMLIKSIGCSKTPTINTPMNKNDFVYVGDVANAFVKAVGSNLPSGIYNLGSGNSTSVYDICRIIEKQILGTETLLIDILKNGQQKESINFWADMDKTNQALNLTNYTLLKDGVNYHIDFMLTGENF